MTTTLPAGWKLVPIEPTDDMETAAENDYEQRGETFPDWKAKYRAMLAAAPTPPASAQDDTLARTGNTSKEQEMFVAGLEAGEANAKNNAAIRAAPASVAPGDAQDERQADACPRCDGSGEITVMSDSSPDAHDVDVCCDHCQGSGSAVDAAKYLAAALSGEKYRHMQVWAEYRNFHRSLCARFGYGHDEIHFRRDLVSLEEAIAAKVAAPAAGDALAALRELVECDNLKKRIASMQVCVLETDDDVQELDAMMSDLARRQPAAWDAARAALAAQVPHKGDAA